ncbi:apolipoprotein M [Alligator sinensis]|uniref:Apolipoprotein M n=1 Tax=Alligator sinensis TaxID=38654 RepID=A0A1U8DM82_ALLSI|nr:apolipoprotein M [Alligator sinensis]
MFWGVWSYLLYLYGALINALSPCQPPTPLPASRVDWEQYLGVWHFVGAAAITGPSLENFASTDGAIFLLVPSAQPGQLGLRAALRLKSGVCIQRSWTYLLKEGHPDLGTEGRPGMRSWVFAGKCPDTIIVQETDHDYDRLLLYGRSPQVANQCLEDFWDQASCLGMEMSLLIPRTHDPCELQDA